MSYHFIKGRSVMKFILSILILFSSFAWAQNDPAFNAQYQVTFEADWSASTHPDNFPSDPHFSGLIGATHHSETHLWQMGEIATPGIVLMAETGSKSILNNEINTLINNNLAQSLLSGGGIGDSPGTVSLNFELSQAYPLVSLVSMIAPSPDWFVGVDSLNMRQNNQWREQFSIELKAYDAGSDSGTNYTSADASTNPPDPITEIISSPFNDNQILGRFVFELLTTDGNFPLEGKHSGLYFNPENSGDGINLTISKQGDRHFATATWYTYRNGAQMWLVGSADFEVGDDSITMDIIRTDGASFGDDFNADDVERIVWGNATISIPSCDHLNMSFTSTENPVESGSLAYQRLANIEGLGCV